MTAIPLFAEDQSYPAWLLRRQMRSKAGPGVVGWNDMAAIPAGGLQLSFNPGDAYVAQTIETQESAFDLGVYFVYMDSALGCANTILAPLVNPRVDLAVLRVYDIDEQGLSGLSKAQYEWVPGSEISGASVTPGDPGFLAGIATVPDNSLLLDYVLQTVGETSISSGNILDVRKFSAPSSSNPWLPLTLSSGITDVSGTPPSSVRLEGDCVRITAEVTMAPSGSLVGAPLVIPIANKKLRPALNTQVVGVLTHSGSANPVGITIDSSGNITPNGGMANNDLLMIEATYYLRHQ